MWIGARRNILKRPVSSAVSYETEASTLFAAMGTQPDTTRKAAINTCIAALKSGSVWTKLIWLHVYGCHAGTAADALLNWKNPGTYNGTAVSSPTFTTDRGFEGNGSTSYVTSSYNPTSAGAPYAQNDAHQGVWVRSGSAQNVTEVGAYDGLTKYCFIQPDFSGQNMAANSAANSIAQTGTTGHFMWSRTTGANFDRYKNGSGANNTQASVGVINLTVFVGALNNSGGADQFSTNSIFCAHMGIGLSSGEVTALYNALNTFKTAIGA